MNASRLPTRNRSALLSAAFAALLGFGALLAAVPSAAQVSRNVTLLSHLNLYAPDYAACWSYVHQDGREYAVILTSKGASFVRLTDPTHPVEVGFINAPHKPWLEAKQYGDHVYLTTEYTKDYVKPENDDALTIVRMTDPDHPQKVADFKSPVNNAHTLAVDAQRGLLYLNGVILACSTFVNCQVAMQIYSLANPENPVLVGSYPQYVHDIHLKGTLGYASLIGDEVTGPDGMKNGTLAILDLADPTHPVEISRLHTPRTLQHSSWTSEDGRTLYAANEWGKYGLTVWDVQNPAAPVQLMAIDALPGNTVHQPHVRGRTLFVSWYTAGARLFDIRNPGWPVEYGYYDTYPGYDGEFHGAWELAPYYPSGIFIVSDIETGLWVFRADPVNYGIVRGTVRDGTNGPPVAGATITAAPSGLSVKSAVDGRYALAIPAGSATLTVTQFAFDTATLPLSVGLDTDQTQNVTLRKSPATTVQGTVRSTTGTALGSAEIDVLGTPLHAVSDASGSYSFPSVPEGTYDIRAVRPGYAPRTTHLTVSRGPTINLGFSLAAALVYDPIESTDGWTLGAPEDPVLEFDPTYGAWVLAEPTAKVHCELGTVLVPDLDHTPDPGTLCFVTDNRIVTFNPCVTGAYSVVTRRTLTSPTLHLAGVTDPRVGYWRWYINNRDDDRHENAAFVTQLSGNAGASWTTIDSSFATKTFWEYEEIPVRSVLPVVGDVLVRFIVDEPLTVLATPMIEALVDDFQAYSGPGTGGSLAATLPATAPRIVFGAPRPIPSRGPTEIALTLGQPTEVRANVFDARGRLVRTLARQSWPAGEHAVRWDGRLGTGGPAASGLYWLRVRAGAEERTVRLVITR